VDRPGYGDDVLPSTAQPGQRVHVRYTKWGDRAHWAYDTVLLGADDHGIWTGGPAGTHLSRPGVSFHAQTTFVMCFSHSSGYAATFWADFGVSSAAAVYVDITTVPVWSALGPDAVEVTMVDLDLDVIRLFDSTLLVDDEDEFAEHQVSFGYPSEVVAAAEAGCRAVRGAVEREEEPFGRVGQQWLDRFSGGNLLGSTAGDPIG
jgi:hypothetical protein